MCKRIGPVQVRLLNIHYIIINNIIIGDFSVSILSMLAIWCLEMACKLLGIVRVHLLYTSQLVSVDEL